MGNDLLTPEEQERYRRQLFLDGWGESAQVRLKRARVCIAGVGGLGCTVVLYLAAAGIGTLTLVDYQDVELSNLNRQVLYDGFDIGRSKLHAAAARLRGLNPAVELRLVERRIERQTVAEIVGTPDLVVDCLDNFETRFILNEYIAANRIPMIHGGVSESYGEVFIVDTPNTPCLRCVFPVDPPAPAGSVPILGAVAGVVGSLQAKLAIDLLRGVPAPSPAEMVMIDLDVLSIDKISVDKDPACPVCGDQ
jgi:molybdopterin-synthase adenylyltransferase